MSIILTVLFIIHLLATLYSGVVVATIYDADAYNEDLISSGYAIAYGIILVFALKLAEYNINLAILLMAAAIIVNILIAKLTIKIDYKLNIKPYLQIKL